MNATSAERIAMESELRHAVERDELFLQFQPCVDAAGLHTTGVEALVRWRHPERGLIPPDRFIPIADESGLIVDIGEWVLRQACHQAKAWHDQGYTDLSVSVNVSAVQFGQPRLLDVVNRALADSGLRPQALTLEITESVVMHDAETAVGMLRAAEAHGRQALHRRLRHRLFLAVLPQALSHRHPQDRQVLRPHAGRQRRGHRHRARHHGAGEEPAPDDHRRGGGNRDADRVAAEGTCDRFQGFHFSRPVDSEVLTERLAREQIGRQAHLH
jgi:EAL domain-containing protein (putative c-di-GMP-specific phosphodiesterase class I)